MFADFTLPLTGEGVNDTPVRSLQDSANGTLFAGGLLLALLLTVAAYFFYSRFAHRHCCDEGKLEELQRELGEYDAFTATHSQRVATLASALLKELGASDLEHRIVSMAAQLHDIGKTGIPVRIISKQGVLNEAEWEVVRQHSELGASLLKQRGFCDEIVQIVKSHHERWDGNGYPMGLRGRQIPLGSRVLSVVDGFDAMTSDRPYRFALHLDEAVYTLRQGSGTQWDPTVVEAFLRIGIPSSYIAARNEGARAEAAAGVAAPPPRSSMRRLVG